LPFKIKYKYRKGGNEEMTKKELKWRIIFAILLALVFVLLVLLLPLVAHAVVHAENSYYKKFSFQADNLTAVIETKDPFGIHFAPINLIATPIIKDSRFWIPIRVVEDEHFGMKIVWDQNQKMVMLSNQNNIRLQFWVGKQYFFMDNEKKVMDVSPFIADGRTYIPLRYFAEALGAKEIIWIPETKSAILVWPLGLD